MAAPDATHDTVPLDAHAAGPRYVRHPGGLYTIIVALFCGLLLISNIAATKLILVAPSVPVLGSIITDGGAFLFPLTYVLGDVLAEVYGLRHARRAIWVGFALAALASVTFLVVGLAPPGPGYQSQDAFVAVLGFFPRIVIASLAGYLAGQLLNAYVLVKIKERTDERALWARLVGSTVVGEFADTALFCVIAFAGILPSWRELVSYTVTGYVYKVLVEVAFLPVTYLVIRAVKRREPGYAPPERVRQLRLVVRTEDFDAALRFYRDRLGLVEEELIEGADGAVVAILRAGRATLELSNPAQVDLIDTVEVGRTGVSPPWRVALEVDDAAAVTRTAEQAGATLIAAPTPTPWRSLNARLEGPDAVQLTLFQELDPAD